jgi:hypothetical protein
MDYETIVCPCGEKMLVPANAAGRRAKCPKCGSVGLVRIGVDAEETNYRSASPLKIIALTLLGCGALAAIIYVAALLAGVRNQTWQGLAESAARIAAAIVAVLVPLILYFLPTIVAVFRKHPNALAIFVLNAFVGAFVVVWLPVLGIGEIARVAGAIFFSAGWLTAMVMACWTIPKSRDG